MKTLGIMFTLFVTVALSAADRFEGRYVMEVNAGGETMDLTVWAKDGHMRMVMGDKGTMPGELVMRDGMSSMLVIMPQQRMYMEMPLEGMIPGSGPEDKEGEGGEEEMPFEKTGETKKILGYVAEKFIFKGGKDGKDDMIVWATDALGSMSFMKNPMMEGVASAMERVTGMKSFFPLEMIGMEKGRDAFQMRIKEVEKKELKDSLFMPPQGYRRMSMPTGMGNMFGN